MLLLIFWKFIVGYGPLWVSFSRRCETYCFFSFFFLSLAQLLWNHAWKRLSFPPLNSFCTSTNDQFAQLQTVLDSVPLILVSIFLPISHGLNWYALMSPELRYTDSSHIFLLFQKITFPTVVSLPCHIWLIDWLILFFAIYASNNNLFYICEDSGWNFNRNYAKPKWQFGENCHFTLILFQSIKTVCLFIYVRLFFGILCFL